MHLIIRLVLLLSLTIYSYQSAFTQSYSWVVEYGPYVNSFTNDIKYVGQGEDKSLLALGETFLGANWLIQFDEKGNFLRAHEVNQLNGFEIQGVAPFVPEAYAFVGNNGANPNANGIIGIVDTSGTFVLVQTLPNGPNGQTNFTFFERLDQKRLVGAGTISVFNAPDQTFVTIRDSSFNSVWTNSYTLDSLPTEPVAFCEDGWGGYFMVTRTSPVTRNFTTYNESLRLTRLSSWGSIVWTRPLPPGFGTVRDMLMTVDGDLLLTGAGDSTQTGACPSSLFEDKALLMKIDTAGNLLDQYLFSNCNISPLGIFWFTAFRYGQEGRTLDYDSNGNIAWAVQLTTQRLLLPLAPGTPILKEFTRQKTIVVTLDSAGNYLFQHPMGGGGYTDDEGSNWIRQSSGDIIAFEVEYLSRSSYLHPNTQLSSANLRVGFYQDTSGNCVWGSQELIPEFKTKLIPPIYSMNQSIDHVAFYELPVDTFQIEFVTDNPYWEQACPPGNANLEVIIASDSLIYRNIGVRPVVACPLLTVDIGNQILRPCNLGYFEVRCRNKGTATAANAVVSVELDPLLSFQTAGLPQAGPPDGNTYSFSLGNFPPGSDTTFQIVTQIDCGAIFGQAICMSGRILPDSFCLPDPAWDGASLEADVWCDTTQDTVWFQVKNVGTGNMAIPGNILVLEDNVMKHNFFHQLNAGQDTTFWELSTGGTWYLQAEQTQGHPGNSIAADVLEGCGTDSLGDFSRGYAANLPLTNWEYYGDQYCTEILAAYDPNDKRGFPMGTGPAHSIDSTTQIDYVIRFQNTGNDTAFNIIIIDTLPPEMDPLSFEAGASSHAYSTTFGPDNTVRFHFPFIYLPDSNVNEPASHGYVQFKMRQVAGNLPGTVIRNDVDIYFDYNEPVRTEEYFHTIEARWYVVSLDPGTEKIGLQVSPNPFSDQVRFQIYTSPMEGNTFEVFDLQGRRVQEQSPTESTWTLEGNGLPNGVYIFRYRNHLGQVATGKITKINR